MGKRSQLVMGLVLAATSVAVGDAVADDHIAVAARASSDHYLHLGVMTDLGVPDGGTASLVVRPVRAIRLHAGVGSNLISTGVRAGITVVPLSWWFSPSVSIDVGRYPEGDANGLARMVMQDPTFSSAQLEHVGYDYLDAHVGFEFGRRWATFYVHAGASRITGNIHNLSDPQQGVTFKDDPRVTLWSPSVRVGLIFYAFK